MWRSEIFYPIGTRTPAPPGRPARSQSLYRLSYPGIVGNVCCFRSNDMVCKSLQFPFPCLRTCLFSTQRLFVFKNRYLRSKVFANTFPGNAYMSQYFILRFWNIGMGFRYKQILTYQRKGYYCSWLINICASASVNTAIRRLFRLLVWEYLIKLHRTRIWNSRTWYCRPNITATAGWSYLPVIRFVLQSPCSHGKIYAAYCTSCFIQNMLLCFHCWKCLLHLLQKKIKTRYVILGN
jgi:hypothetical protein